jgi:hypothetical protein
VDRRGGKAGWPRADDHAILTRGLALFPTHRRQRPPGRGDETAGGVVHGKVDMEMLVNLAQARPEPGRIVEALGGEGGEVASHRLGHLVSYVLTRAQREHEGGGGADHEEDTEEVQVDARVQARHVSRPPARARSRRRERS